MNIKRPTSNVYRRTQARAENQSCIVFTSCFIGWALLAVMLILSSLYGFAWGETADATAKLQVLSPNESRAILERLGRLRKDILTFQADFVEKRTIPSLVTPLQFEGRIYYQNNGIFFMEYVKPLRHILRVLKNEALFFVEGSTTADLVDMPAANGLAGNPDIFALNPDKLSGQILEGKTVYVLEDTGGNPDGKGPNQKLLVSLEKKSLLVKEIRIEDESGDITEICLFNVQINLDIPKSISAFELPDGVKINRLHQP